MLRSRGRRVLLAGLPLVAFTALGASAAVRDAPSSLSSPTITGPAVQGATLTASNGTWSGTAPLAYSLQWLRCSPAGESCAEIPGASSQTYVVAAADVGRSLRVRVTVTNSEGQATDVSDPTAAIASTTGPAPVNTALPTITGTAVLGGTISTSSGTWTGTPAPTYSYGWLQCDPQGASCTAIPGASSSTYRVQAGDLGGTLRSVVTASNSSGQATARSLATLPVGAGGGPRSTSPPSIVGTAKVGSTLTISVGGWSGTGLVQYLYAWERCNARGTSCTPIDKADNRTYTVVAADAGSRLRASVTAKDADGSTTETAGVTAIVPGSAPSNGSTPPASSPTPVAPTPVAGGVPGLVAQPIVSGLFQAGATIRTSDGSWTSAPGLHFAEAWLRCDAKGLRCVPLRHARKGTYRLTRADAGRTLRSQVTALNLLGSSIARSDPTAVVGRGPALRIHGGRYSIPAGSLTKADRLHVNRVRLTGRTVRVTVTDGHGNVVRGATVAISARGYRSSHARTHRTGVAALRLRGEGHGGRVAVTVRATASRATAARRVVRLRVR